MEEVGIDGRCATYAHSMLLSSLLALSSAMACVVGMPVTPPPCIRSALAQAIALVWGGGGGKAHFTVACLPENRWCMHYRMGRRTLTGGGTAARCFSAHPQI